MCGIVGIVSSKDSLVETGEICRFVDYLHHRGPDGQGVWVSPEHDVGLGHARLSILDLSVEAGQPMVSGHGGHVIVFNGEIYNFVELARELREHGYEFRTQSDTEVLLHGWDCWGMTMFSRINGMWALAIYDVESGETLLCRDRFGVKPLYYHTVGGRFLFASEIQSIDRFTDGRLEVDYGFYAGLKQLEVGEGTHLVGVKALLPGSYLKVTRSGTVEGGRWYGLSRVEVPSSFPEQVEGLRELVIDACRIRLRSDVPVATCLSGGLDSGSIVSLLHAYPGDENQFPGFNHRCFTAAFPDSELDETRAARSLTEAYDLTLDLKVMECPTLEELEESLYACDGPMPTMAFYPIWKLYQHVRRKGIVVTMDGMGPDEMLGGYFIGGDALRGAWHLKDIGWFVDVYRTYRSLYDNGPEWMRGELKQFARERGSALKKMLRRLVGGGSQTPLRMYPLPVWVPENHPLRENPFERALWHQFFAAPLPFFLNQYDRCSMASGVESRMPFMDYRVVEYVFSLPLQSRVSAGYTKRVLREAVKGILPDHIRLNRRKTGFNAPFAQWLQGPLREWATEIASTSEFLENPCFDGVALSAAIKKNGFEGCEVTREREIWPALHLAWWMRHRSRS